MRDKNIDLSKRESVISDTVNNDPIRAKDIAIDVVKKYSDDFDFLVKINRLSYGYMNLHEDFKK